MQLSQLEAGVATARSNWSLGLILGTFKMQIELLSSFGKVNAYNNTTSLTRRLYLTALFWHK